MNIVNKLTLRHLKENKGRTVVTTLGIIVSVAMITAVFVALASFMNLFGEIELVSTGRYHAQLETTPAQFQALEQDDRISHVGINSSSDYDSSYQLSKRKSNPTGTGEFVAGDKTFIQQKITGNYDGTLPEHKGEIAVEQKLIDKNQLGWKIGDTVEIPTGSRTLMLDGEELEITGSYESGEKFTQNTVEAYVITAILHSNPATAGNSIILCSVDEHTIFKEDTLFYSTIALEQVNHKSLDVIEDIIKQNSIENYNINYDYLQTKFAFGADNTLMASLISISAIILVIIMIASVVLIYNAFAMSISERVRYLGMLSSVGATKKQKRLSVYFEGFILGAIGIPVGILSGIIGIGITLKAIGGKIIESGMIMGIDDSNMQMDVVVPIWVIAGIILLSIFTIYISSYIPARKASGITAIDAIRQTSEVKVKAKRLRSSRLIRLIFGYEGELANKNLKRNGRKARVITSSIALSVILFLSCNFFCTMFTQSVATEAEVPYQMTATIDYEHKDELIKQLDDMAQIDEHYCVNNIVTYFDSKAVNKIKFADSENYTLAYKNFCKDGFAITLNMLDDEDFNLLCRNNGIDSSEYYSGKQLALLMNNVSHRKNSGAVFTSKVIGSKLKDLFDVAYDETAVGALVDYDEDFYACNLNIKNSISLYMPISQANRMNTAIYMAGIETDNHSEAAEALYEFGESTQHDVFYLNDFVDALQAMNAISFVLQVLVYGFITLITLITVFNIINTISTGVAMRKKEFAMLRSVGTTPMGMKKMVMLESGFYGMKALVFALPISALISYFMYLLLGISAIGFEIDWLLYLAVTAVVIAIVGATMLYSVHKIKDDNIVETLKEDIT